MFMHLFHCVLSLTYKISMGELANALKGNNETDIKVGVGRVWTYCDKLKKLKFDGSLAHYVAEAVKNEANIAKDALSEINELVDFQQDVDEDSDNDNEEAEFGEGHISAEAKQWLPNCQLIMKTVLGFLRQISVMLQLVKDESTQEVKDWLLELPKKTVEITASVDDIAILFYEEFEESAFIELSNDIESKVMSLLEYMRLNGQISKHEDKLNQLKKAMEGFFEKTKEKSEST